VAIQWGTWQIASGSTNGMRLGVDVTYSAVTASSPTCVVTFKVYSENKFAYNDTQTLTYGGTAGVTGTLNFTNTSTTGQQVLRDTKTWTHTYAANGLGASKTFSATLSGAFNNVTPTVTVTATVPSRGTAPGAVTELHLERVSDTQGIVTWNNPGGPITTNTVMRQEIAYGSGAWVDITPPFTSGAPIETLTSNSLRPNMLFRFQVRANNAVGSGPYAISNLIFTTPAAPGNVVATRQPQGVVLTWTVTHPPTNQGQASTRYTQHIEVSTDGSTWTEVKADFVPSSSGTQTFTDHNPPSLAATYRVTTWTPDGLVSLPGVAAEIPALPGKIFAGSERALTIYAGSDRAHKIYMGSTQVWP
jgi:hypothetical protein